jgi:glutamate synthase (NADPH) small chain
MYRQKVPRQPVKNRVRNFKEVALGFNRSQAIAEARRCLQCRVPLCRKGCPVEIDIPAFIKLVAEGKPREALCKIKEKNNLPAVCGRVCPQENQCEYRCVLNQKQAGINIGGLERYAADRGKGFSFSFPFSRKAAARQESTGRAKVAVVGSGPAGLTAAGDLAKMGYDVTLFESLHLPGGVLMYGIPEFRLPKEIVLDEVEYIKSLGVKLETNVLVGRTYTIEELFQQGFLAIFVGTGAGLPQFLGIPGENLNRVYSANEFLTRINLMKGYRFPEFSTPLNIGKKICVVGAGNVAFDCCRVAIRLQKEVTLVYRRSETEMPARKEEVDNAKEEGLKFSLLTQPKEILSDEKGFVRGLKCIKMELGQPDESGRRRPVAIPGSEFIFDCDTVIVAIGQNPNPLLAKSTAQLRTNEDGTICVDGNFMTSIKGVFAGGDIATGADTVISAMGAGKKAASCIDRFIKNA